MGDKVRTIHVTVPEKCYISASPLKSYPFRFFFSVHYGYIDPDEFDETVSETKSEDDNENYGFSRIKISGFERIIGKEKFKAFVDNISKEGSLKDDWVVTFSDDLIILKYCDPEKELPPYFTFTAYYEKFIPDTVKNGQVVLGVSIENFNGIPDHSYNITTRIDFVPWAKSIAFSPAVVDIGDIAGVAYEYAGDDCDKKLYQDVKEISTSASPYLATILKPCWFTLRVFTVSGMRVDDSVQAYINVNPPKITSFTSDRKFFHKGESVTLSWTVKSVESTALDNFNAMTDSYITNERGVRTGAKIYPISDSRTAKYAAYILKSEGYCDGKSASDTQKIVLTETCWKESGTVTGVLNGNVYGNTLNNCVYMHDKKFYCYVHPKLYQSNDGLSWTEFSTNPKSDASFIPIATGYFDKATYIMGKTNSGKLGIATFTHASVTWSYSSAGQVCYTQNGCFALSGKVKRYAQIQSDSITFCTQGTDGSWRGTGIITHHEGKSLINGDYCFFYDSFYTAMLCSEHLDKRVYVYKSINEVDEPIFDCLVGNNDTFVKFIRSNSNFYVVTDSTITNVKTGSAADLFMPAVGAGQRPWLGGYSGNMMYCIYPDKKLWKFIEEVHL